MADTLNNRNLIAQSDQQTSVWVVRPGGQSGRVSCIAASAAESSQRQPYSSMSNDQDRRPSTPGMSPRDSLPVVNGVPRMPRSLGLADIHESMHASNILDPDHVIQRDEDQGEMETARQLEEARRHNTSSARNRGNINDINKRWDEMMKSSLPGPASGGSPASETVVSTSAGNKGELKSEVVSNQSPVVIADSIQDSNKQKKSISFSGSVMYRSVSNLELDNSQALLNQQLNAIVSEIWSDDESEGNDTLYSEEGNEWPKDDEFEAMVDGTNIMSLPFDDEEEEQIQGRNPLSDMRSANVSRNVFNSSPVHRLLRTQTVIQNSPPPPHSQLEFAQIEFAQLSPLAANSLDSVKLSGMAADSALNHQVINLELPTAYDVSFCTSLNALEAPIVLSQPNVSGLPPSTPPNRQSASVPFSDGMFSPSTNASGLSPILIRSENEPNEPISPLFVDIPKKVLKWDDLAVSHNGKSSPWIKQTVINARTEQIDPITRTFSEESKHERGDDKREILTGGEQIATRVKAVQSCDSLVLEEEEIVLENVKPGTDIKTSTAFFIPLEKSESLERNSAAKPAFTTSYLQSNFKSALDNAGEISTSLTEISHADPVVVNVAPQSPKPQSATNRGTASDAWIAEKTMHPVTLEIITRSSPTISKSANKSKKSSPISKQDASYDSFYCVEETTGSDTGSSMSKPSISKQVASADTLELPENSGEAEVPIVVIKMSDTAPRNKRHSSSKVRSQKSTKSPEIYHSTPRESVATLVNRDSMSSLKAKINEKIISHRVTLSDNVAFPDMDTDTDLLKQTYPTSKLRMAPTARGYVPMPVKSNQIQYPIREQKLRPSANDPYTSPYRRSSFHYNPTSYSVMNYDEPYKSQSALYLNPEVQRRWSKSMASLNQDSIPVVKSPLASQAFTNTNDAKFIRKTQSLKQNSKSSLSSRTTTSRLPRYHSLDAQ
ncbi:hypothetical protein BC830DRAFT_796174 [Chytriomyces sp. MP71]|nr:hypothetical protein BC830DRAFT_796174 [Chytriomyces sp. MP71]